LEFSIDPLLVHRAPLLCIGAPPCPGLVRARLRRNAGQGGKAIQVVHPSTFSSSGTPRAKHTPM
jgi:hypothetical protein